MEPARVLAVSNVVARLADRNWIRVRDFLDQLGLDASAFNLTGAAQHVWRDVLRSIQDGRSARLGGGEHALIAALDLIAEALPGNRELQELLWELGRGESAAVPVPGVRTGVGAMKGERWFISYARTDAAAVAPLYEALVARIGDAHSVYLDTRSTQPGGRWLDVLRANLHRTGVLACWVTGRFLCSGYTAYEVGVAEACGARVVPLIRDPAAFQAAPLWLQELQGVPAADPIDYDRLAQALLELR